jgi:isohexenylglutaconyl-CoA hydratase|tara:strand:+ start:8115 stop:8921 length:807 start_codon:yes stop_codon:yes gene_type:complete
MVSLPDTEQLLLVADNGWLTIWLNRPESRNALSEQMSAELRSTLEAVHDERSVRGITLRGRDGVFCAGGDLKAFRADFQAGSAGIEAVAAASRKAGELFDLVYNMPQIVVILVEGAAIAGGLGLACAGDVVVVTGDARFSLTETTLGIPPAQIAPFVVHRLGTAAARRIMLTAARFDGQEAGKMGLADYVVDDAEELQRVEQQIRTAVMRCAPGANAATKEILRVCGELDRQSLIDFASRSFAECLLSDEGREGISAFIEKRRPGWSE